MQAPQGYQLKLSNSDTIRYPGTSGSLQDESTLDQTRSWVSDHWDIDPTQYEFSSTLTGYFSKNEKNATREDHEIGVFVNGELRGATKSIYIAALDRYLFFLTMYANEPGESLEFKIYDNFEGSLIELSELFSFEPDLHRGSVESPIPFTEVTSGVQKTESVTYFEVYPNPFTQNTNVVFHADKSMTALATVVDALGRKYLQRKVETVTGMNKIELNLQDILPGVYFIHFEMADGIIIRKVIKG
jgi:hypothetical protein